MPDIVIHVIASAAYVGLAWHFWRTRWRHQATPGSASRMAERVAILAVLGIHGTLLYSEIFAAPELRFGFAQALAVMIWLAVLICWVEALFYRVEALYPAALLAAAVCAPLPAFYPGRVTPDSVSFEFRLHLIFGLLSYSLFIVEPRAGATPTPVASIPDLIKDGKRMKAESVTILDAQGDTLRILILFDGPRNGEPHEYRLSFK